MATQISELRVQGRAEVNQLTAQLAATQASLKGVQKSVNDLGNAAEQAGKKTEQAFSQRGFNRVLRELDPTAAAATARLKDHERQIRVLDSALARGVVSQTAYNRLAAESARVLAGPTAATLAYGKALDGVQGAAAGLAARLGPLGAALGAIGPVGLAAAAGVAAVGTVLTLGIREAEKAAQSYNRLSAVLTATGNAAGLTAQQIDAVADEIEKSTLASGEAVLDAAAALATFGSVAGSNFSRTLKAAQDMAAVFGGDTRGAVLQLARALDDPVNGLDRLRRAGIAVTAGQRELIRELARTGDVAGAQTKILEEVERRVGGAGIGERQGVAGASKGLADSWSDLLKEIGRTPAVVSAAQAALAGLKGVVDGVRGYIASGSGPGPDAQIATLEADLARLSGGRPDIRNVNAASIAAIEDRLRDLRAGQLGGVDRAIDEGFAQTGAARAAQQRAEDALGVRAKAMGEIVKQQEEELRIAGLVGREKDKAVAADRARLEVLKAAGFQTREEAAGLSDVLEAAEKAAGIAASRVDTEARIALNVRAQAQALEDAAAQAAQIDRDRRDARQASKDLETAGFGLIGNADKQIKLLEDQAKAAQAATIEYDAVSQTYRVVSRDLAVLNELQKFKVPEGAALDPDEIRKRAEALADAQIAIDRIKASQDQYVEQLNRQNELMLEPFKNLIEGAQDTLADFFQDWIEGTETTGESLKRLAVRFASEFAAAFAVRPAVGGLLQLLGGGQFAQQMGYGAFAQGALGSAGGAVGGAAGAGTGALGFLGSVGSFLGPVGLGAAAIGIPIVGGLLGKLFGGGGPDPDEIARQQFLTSLRQRQASVTPSVNAFIAGGTERSSIGRQFTDLYEEYVQLYSQLSELYNDLAPTTDQMAALTQAYNRRAAGLREEFIGDLERQLLAITDKGGEAARTLADTAEELELAAREANAGFAQVAELIAAMNAQARDAADRDAAVALGTFTGDPSAAWDELVRQQQERRRTVETLGGDMAQAEAALAAERLQYLRGLSDAQRALIEDQLGEADQGLSAIAAEGLTLGEKLQQGAIGLKAFAETFDDWLKGLEQSDLSPLSQGAKYGASRDQLAATIDAARAGDPAAIARVQAEAQGFLASSRGIYASGDQYLQDYAWVTGLLGQLASDAPGLSTSLGQQGIAANQQLVGGVAQQILAEQAAAAEAAAAAQQAALAAKAPGLLAAGGGGGAAAAANQTSANQNIPNWQLWQNAGGFTPGMADALVQVLYGGTTSGVTFAGASQDAQNAVNSLLYGDAYGYLTMGGGAAAGTLINSGIYTAQELYSKYGSYGLTGLPGWRSGEVGGNLSTYLAETLLGGDQGGVGGGGSTVGGAPGQTDNNNDGTMSMGDLQALGLNMAIEAFKDVLNESTIGFNPFSVQAIAEQITTQLGPQIAKGLPGSVVNMAQQLKELVTQQIMSQQTPNIGTLTQIKNNIDLVVRGILSELGAYSGGGDGGAGNSPGGGVGNNNQGQGSIGMGTMGGQVSGPSPTGGVSSTAPSAPDSSPGHGLGQGVGDAEPSYSRGGTVWGGIPGRDSVRSWLTPEEEVIRAAPARRHRGLLKAINNGLPLTPYLPPVPVPVQVQAASNDGGAVVGVLRDILAVLGEILSEEQKATLALRLMEQKDGGARVGETRFRQAG